MSDPLMNFLMTRDPAKVIAEGRGVSLERLYAEATAVERELIDEMPIGELRRKLAQAEEKIARMERDKNRKVKVVGGPELMGALRRMTERARAAEAKIAELQQIRQKQADMIAELRGKVRELEKGAA